MNRCNIFLFIGQFGNQIGKHLVEFLSSMKGADLVQRSCSFISVDTEQKTAKMFTRLANVVVEKCILDKTGRGANWAMGYNFQREHNCSLSQKDIVLETIKRKIEKFHDRLPGIIMIHSLIGGTGGGLGCCILESVKDEFPEIHITSVTTSPFVSGESPMQHYNALFTLAWLQRYSDCVLLFHNDEVMTELRKAKSKSTSGKRIETVSLDEINDYICYNILDLFHPLAPEYEEKISFGKTKYTTETTITRSKKLDMKPSAISSHIMTGFPKTAEAVLSKSNSMESGIQGSCIDFLHNKQKAKALIGIRQRDSDFIRTDKRSVIGKFDEMDLCEKEKASNQSHTFLQHLSIDHHMKFISSKQKHTRQFSSEYFPLLKSLMLDQPKCDHDGNKYSVHAMLLSARGQFAKVIAYNEHDVLSYLRGRTLFRRGCDKHVSITTSFLPATSYNAPLSLSLYMNTNRVADYIDHVLCKSEMLYEHSAYTHWFYKFGVNNGCFEDAFDTLKGVVKEYRTP